MVVCQTLEDYDLLKCRRAHGWARDLSERANFESAHPDVDPRFLFVNVGYNLRPMEIQAALGKVQLLKLNAMNANRLQNYEKLKSALLALKSWLGQFVFPAASTDNPKRLNGKQADAKNRAKNSKHVNWRQKT